MLEVFGNVWICSYRFAIFSSGHKLLTEPIQAPFELDLVVHITDLFSKVLESS